MTDFLSDFFENKKFSRTQLNLPLTFSTYSKPFHATQMNFTFDEQKNEFAFFLLSACTPNTKCFHINQAQNMKKIVAVTTRTKLQKQKQQTKTSFCSSWRDHFHDVRIFFLRSVVVKIYLFKVHKNNTSRDKKKLFLCKKVQS